ncbi:SDR family NAD(P)-dependent oxidoreductase [Caballeronia insecticola]|uniref:Short-chain dehydrogenase/reductase SDR n=1 Tax=Caballeronia insecticola TaxID=758793 RepID=R4WUB2_9BURK|nr:SDR family NAD(P)-dependent oxidoreductase [Caballeronia insecticola]BAN28178.1 short-chain dehydrogenase/reductase SDR [Caballeronia insecticola]
MYNFSNRTLLLTGANGGIGREIARLFYSEGANLILTDLDETALREFAGASGFDARRVVCMKMDASSAKDAEDAVALAMQSFGGIDFLVPSAGIYLAQPFDEMTDEQWHRTIAINLDGVFYLCRRALGAMRENSAIVNLTSLAGHRGAFYNAHYSASKGGVLSLTRSLARELAPRTRVNAVSPGIIETPMTASLVEKRGADSIGQTPLGRLGQAREVATAVGFFCSDASSFITGEVLQVNGGLYMAG